MKWSAAPNKTPSSKPRRTNKLLRDNSFRRDRLRLRSLQAPEACPIPAWDVAPRTSSAFVVCLAATLVMSLVLGCNSTPIHTTSTITVNAPATPRPTTPPSPFKLFHATPDSITLVTSPTATDDQISAILWQLRDAAHAHTFDALHIPQKVVDARDPMVWFHLYRGPKCAAEKYAEGAPPCGPSYHAAGDYTFGGGPHRDWDSGVLLHDENHETQLWPPGSPYTSN
jgi:hypothetical protein